MNLVSSSLTFLITASLALAQGPLTPPGPPAPTQKTLQQFFDNVEGAKDDRTPIVLTGSTTFITQPGSYYLAENVTTDSGEVIRIQSSNVNLDLNGFLVTGSGTDSSAIAIIGSNNFLRKNIRIHNGAIQGPALGGITFDGTANVVIENIRLTRMAVHGIGEPTSNPSNNNNLLIRNCLIEGTTSDAGLSFSRTRNGTIQNCSFRNSANCGLKIKDSSSDEGIAFQIKDCRFSSNASHAIEVDTGPSLYGSISLTDCQFLNNQGFALYLPLPALNRISFILTKCQVTRGAGGIIVGDSAILTDCIIRETTSTVFQNSAITTGKNCSLTNCLVYENTLAGTNSSRGIQSGSGSTLVQCNVSGNSFTAAVATGILAPASSIENCSVIGNSFNGSGQGINASGSALANCEVVSNSFTGSTATGIDLGFSSTMENSIASGNSLNGSIAASGIQSTTGAKLRNCGASSNQSTGSNFAGIRLGPGSTAEHCTASEYKYPQSSPNFAQGRGFIVSEACTVSHCFAYDNTSSGFVVSNDCFVLNNTSNRNGFGQGFGRGIHSTGSNCRIEGNHTSENDVGVEVDLPRNTIIKNTATANHSNYEIAPNNTVGPVVVPSAGAAISGNGPAPGSTNSTNPFANFSN